MARKLLSTTLLLALCLTILLICFYAIASARENQGSRPAHIGFFYPISTNGTLAGKTSNDFSFHVLAGVSLRENAFCLSGIASIVKENANGVLISGISNHVGRGARGLQLAGIVNEIKKETSGAQIAGICNISGNMTGLQIAGLANIAADQHGLQIAGLINKSKNANAQIAGILNMGKKVRGIQISGLINIADECDYPIGLINIIKNGEKQIGLTVDESGNTIIAFRSGGRVLYGILGAGYNYPNPDARYVLEGGMGAHIGLSRHLRLNMEITLATMSDLQNDVFMKTTLRPLISYRIAQQIELFAGPTLNHSGPNDLLWEGDGVAVINDLYFGWLAGIQINL